MKTALSTILLALALGCSKNGPATSAPSTATAPASKEFRPPAREFLNYKTPPEWISEEPTEPMRKAQYRIPDKKGKAAPAVLTFFGMAPQNEETIVDYWREKMGGADASVTKIQGAASPTTLVDITGEYTGERPPVANARFLGAIVETGQRNWYLKFVGPADTVSGWKDAFVEMLKGVRPLE